MRRRTHHLLAAARRIPCRLGAGATAAGDRLPQQRVAEQLCRICAFRQGLSGAGYVEGRKWIEYCLAGHMTAAAGGRSVRQKVALIVAPGHQIGAGGKAATTTIPILFMAASTPFSSTRGRHPAGRPRRHQPAAAG
jgi:hypothetical protein